MKCKAVGKIITTQEEVPRMAGFILMSHQVTTNPESLRVGIRERFYGPPLGV